MSDLDDTVYFEKMLSFINKPEKKHQAIEHYKEQNKRAELQSGSITETELKELYKNELIKDGIINDSDVDSDEFLEDDDFEEEDDLDPQNIIVGEKNVMGYSSSDSDYDSDSDEIKKLENSINKDLLINFHPEIKKINHNELVTLSKVVKDKNGMPIDPLHKTVPFLTKYEKARILGLRAKQINSGSDIFVDVPSNIFDGYTIAQIELEQKKIPFIIRRPLPNGSSEFWHVNDLELI
tara:strand:- start:882 stop:1592 length:711 start_codon:yes stop_codon:yes gene_type:complete